MVDIEALRREVHVHAVKSRGPGGQNVNKVSSAARLTWSLLETKLFSGDDLRRIQKNLSGRLTKSGELVIRCDEFRDLERNKARALEKLLQALRTASHKPKPRRATRPTKASKTRRLDKKKQRGETKKMRGRVSY